MRTCFQWITALALFILTSTSVHAQRYYRGRGYHGGYYGGHYGRSYGYYAPLIRTSFIGHPYRIIPFGGISYYYTGGYFYRPYGASFSLIFPPFGIHVGVLPYGYRTIYVGTVPYYYFNGIFYNRYDDYYEVVKAPIGAEVPDIPAQAKMVTINDQRFYELNGTYYKEVVRDNGEVWYRVVGKHGVLNTDSQSENEPAHTEAEKTPLPPSSEIGTTVTQLPPNSKVVVINNQKMYEAPDGTFYSEVIEDNHINYKVVGK